jgi:large subunit ribosomal protein L15
MPLQRRIPKRGFNNVFAKTIVSVNVGTLDKFEDGSVVDTQALIDAGIVKTCCDGVKILANGNLTKKLTVKVTAYSEAAKQKIETAGGKAEVI